MRRSKDILFSLFLILFPSGALAQISNSAQDRASEAFTELIVGFFSTATGGIVTSPVEVVLFIASTLAVHYLLLNYIGPLLVRAQESLMGDSNDYSIGTSSEDDYPKSIKMLSFTAAIITTVGLGWALPTFIFIVIAIVALLAFFLRMLGVLGGTGGDLARGTNDFLGDIGAYDAAGNAAGAAANQAGNLLERAGEALEAARQNDDPDDARQALDQIEQILVEAGEDLEEAIQVDIQEVEEAIEIIRRDERFGEEEIELEEDVEQELGQIIQALDHPLHEYLEDFDRLDNVLEDARGRLQRIEEFLQQLRTEEREEEEELQEEYQDLANATRNLELTIRLVRMLRQVVQGDEELLEELIQTVGMDEDLENHEEREQWLEDQLAGIEAEISDALDLLGEAYEGLNMQERMTAEEIEELREDLEETAAVRERLEEVGNDLRDAGYDTNHELVAEMEALLEMLDDIGEVEQNLEGRDEEIVETERQLEEEIEELLREQGWL